LRLNDALMAVFFVVVGLEVKREVLDGELSSLGKALLPGIAAIGGMVVPATVYVLVNWGDPTALRGWAIPSATDIAFAVGVVALLGHRVPHALKVFLLALAIFDDLGAVAIIAVFYTEKLSLLSLGLALVGVAALVALNSLRVTRYAPYVLVAVFIWLSVLESGVHATLSGVLIGLAVPLRSKDARRGSPLEHLERMLHPWVTDDQADRYSCSRE
jgi:Na+:H+ antiporter, NhaA family